MKYDASSITWLQGLEGVRKKSQMYIGNPDSNGLFQIVKELIDNAIDEASNKHAKEVGFAVIGKHPDQEFWVWDNGRGVPVGPHSRNKKVDTLTIIYTELHAGGKMDANSTAYNKGSSGTHGVGAAVSNAMSKEFAVHSYRNNVWHEQKFKIGKPQGPVIKNRTWKAPKFIKIGKVGTIINFKPDLSIFDKGSKFEIGKLKDWLSNICFLFPGIRFVINDNGREIVYLSRKGYKEYLDKQLATLKIEADGKPLEIGNSSLNAVLQWTDSSEDGLLSYANGSKTSLGGTHVDGVKKAIYDALGAYAGTRSKYNADDLLAGLIGMINYSMVAPQFDSQTKSRLIAKDAKDKAYQAAFPDLKTYFAANKALAKRIIQRANAIREVTEAAKLDRKAAGQLKSKVGGKSNMPSPDKYAAALSRNPEEIELVLVEGSSASGEVKKARDKNKHAVLALKGKVLNVSRATNSRAFDNVEILDILKSVGYDPDNKKDPMEKPKVGKIILLADPDADGPVRGDTRVLTLDGKNPTIKTLAKRWKNNTNPIWVYSCNENGEIVPAKGIHPRKARTVSKLAIIKFTDGSIVRCTVDHEMVLRNGKKVQAQHLKKGASLASVYFEASTSDGLKRKDGRYLALIGDHGQHNHYPRMPVHRWVMMHVRPKTYKRWLRANKNSGWGGAVHFHHRDEDPLNNLPSNLEFIEMAKHNTLHMSNYAKAYNGSKKHLKDLEKFYYTTKEGKKFRKQAGKQLTDYNVSEEHRETVRKLNADVKQKKLQSLGKQARYYLALQNMGLKITEKSWETHRLRVPAAGIFKYQNLDIKEVAQFIEDYQLQGSDAYELRKKTIKHKFPQQRISKFISICKELQNKGKSLTERNYTNLRTKRGVRGDPKWDTIRPIIKTTSLEHYVSSYNHTVASVRIIDCQPTDVYCMSVPETGNFMVADKNGNGICSGNSHINLLLLTAIQRLVPKMIKEGRVFVIDAPLFMARWGKDNREFGHTLAEVYKLVPKGVKPNITRFKGWGEASYADLQPIVFGNKRRLIQVKAPNTKSENERFLNIVGEATSERKRLLGIE